MAAVSNCGREMPVALSGITIANLTSLVSYKRQVLSQARFTPIELSLIGGLCNSFSTEDLRRTPGPPQWRARCIRRRDRRFTGSNILQNRELQDTVSADAP